MKPDTMIRPPYCPTARCWLQEAVLQVPFSNASYTIRPLEPGRPRAASIFRGSGIRRRYCLMARCWRRGDGVLAQEVALLPAPNYTIRPPALGRSREA